MSAAPGARTFVSAAAHDWHSAQGCAAQPPTKQHPPRRKVTPARVTTWTRFIAAVLLFAVATTIARGATAAPGPDVNPDAQNIPPLRPAHPEIPPGFWESYGGWVILGAVLLLALIVAFVWYLKKCRKPVPEAPDKKARQILEQLAREPEDGLVISRVSQVLRHYIASAFSLPPGELTTAEFCRAIRGNDMLGEQLSTEISEFLRRCDERKFSPGSVNTPLAAAAQGLKFVDMAEAQRAQYTQQRAGNPSSRADEQRV